MAALGLIIRSQAVDTAHLKSERIAVRLSFDGANANPAKR
jgi:hypothetical protein